MALIDKLTKANFVPTKLPTKVPAEKVNEIIDELNALQTAGVSTTKVLNSEAGGLYGSPLLGFRPAAMSVFFEDFIDTYGCLDMALANESDPSAKFSEVADRGSWLVSIVDSAGGNTETVIARPVDGTTSAGAQGGWGEFRTCNADNDAITCQLNGESFKLAAGKKLWFETQFIIEDVSESEIFIGLADTGTELYGAAGVGVNNHIGFMLDGDGNLDFSIDEGGTQYKVDLGIDFVDGSMATLATTNVKHKCGFYWDGGGNIYIYIDDVLVRILSDNGTTLVIPDGTCLSPGFTLLTQGTSDEAIFIDYIYIAQER